MFKQWLAFVTLGALLMAGGCKDDGGAALPQPGSFPPATAAPEASLHPAGASAPAALNSPPAGNVLTMEEATAIAKQLHGKNGPVEWSAELQHGVEIEGAKRDVWRVEALFSAGNRWWYWLDAGSGKLLVLTELEAPSAEEKTFNPYLTETENGLRLEWDKSLHPDVSIMQTLESPEANKLAVHLVRRSAYVKGRERFLLDAVIVNPAGKSLRTVPLADIDLAMDAGMDSYTASSFAQAYGFVHGEQLILTVPATRQGKLQYDALSLQIRTGETSVLAEGIMSNPAPDWLARGWLDSGENKLYLNLFQSGELWVTDLHTGQAQKTAVPFSHRWPYISLYPSPDGARFVYRSQEGSLGLYTADGKQLAELPGKEGFYSRPPAAWSPDGRRFTLETTPDQNEAYIISTGENGFLTLAPKTILLFDHNGNRLAEVQAEERQPGGHIELAGWLADGSAAVLHTYKLERQKDVPARRVQSAYFLMDSQGEGSLVPLAKVDRIEDMERPEAIFGKADGRLVFIDRSSRRYWAQGGEYGETQNEQGQGEALLLVSEPGREPIRWTTSYQGNGITLHSYFPAAKKTVQTPLSGNGPYPMTIRPDIVYDSGAGYLRLE